ncbi:MAG TPA: hypothetical protein EYP14_16685, partial [Planctomycetaceae bacterium]|nr:hypothetical protein [Planctomycetaceae bacterium]
MDETAQRIRLAEGLALLAGLAIVAPVELARVVQSVAEPGGLAGVFYGLNIDTSLFLWLFLLLPLFWRPRPGRKESRRPKPPSEAGSSQWLWLIDSPRRPRLPPGQARRRALLLAGIVAVVSWSASVSVARVRVSEERPWRFGDLPPALHDEYSYLFQAKTFLAGRLWFPSHPDMPHLFDQMHVL